MEWVLAYLLIFNLVAVFVLYDSIVKELATLHPEAWSKLGEPGLFLCKLNGRPVWANQAARRSLVTKLGTWRIKFSFAPKRVICIRLCALTHIALVVSLIIWVKR